MDYIKFITDRVDVLKSKIDVDLEYDEILDILIDELNSGKLSQVELSNYKILVDKVDWNKCFELKQEIEQEIEEYEEEGE